MAGENIVRDFTTEQLKYIYDEVIDNPLAFTSAGIQPSNLATVDHTAIVEKFYGVEYASILGAASGERDSLRERNNTMAANLIKTWETVGTIDTRYQGLFSKLKSTMQEYLKAVNQIAEMIDTSKKESNLGIWAPNAIDSMSSITENFNKKMQEYNDFCVIDALTQVGITDPDEQKKVLDFTKGSNYSTQQAVALALAVKTEKDKEVLFSLVNKKYSDIFNINPDKLSAEMLQSLSDYASLLAINDKWPELTTFINSVSKAEKGPNGKLQSNKYVVEYLAFLEVGLSRQLSVYSTYLKQQVSSVNSDGSINWLENAEINTKMEEALKKLYALDSIYQLGIYLENSSDTVLKDYEDSTKFSNAKVQGFYFTEIKYDKNLGSTDFDFFYQIKQSTRPQAQIFENTFSYYETSVKGNKTSLLSEKTIGQYYTAMSEIQDARTKAWQKYNAANVVSGASFLASMIPGGSTAMSAVSACLNVAQELYKTVAANGNDYTSVGSSAASGTKDVLLEKYGNSNINSYISSFYDLYSSAIGNVIDYNNSMKDLNSKELEASGVIMQNWFGNTTNFGFSGIDRDGTNFGVNGIGFAATHPTSFQVLYGQQQWSNQGISYLFTDKTKGDGTTPIQKSDIYSFNKDSLLGQYISNKPKFNTSNFNNDSDWINFINANFSEEEKLVWFGSNPSATTGKNGIDKPETTFQNINTSESIENFIKTTEDIKNATSTAFGTKDDNGDIAITADPSSYDLLNKFNSLTNGTPSEKTDAK